MGLGSGLSKTPTDGRFCRGYGAGLQGTGLQAGDMGAGGNAKKSAGRSAGHRGGAKKKSVPDRGVCCVYPI